MTEPASAGGGVDLQAYLQVLLRRRWVILGVWLGVFLGVLGYTLRQPKVYQATASLIIDVQSPRVLENQTSQEVLDNGTGTYWFNKEYYETQYKVIVSRAVSQRVADKLGLAHDAGFLGVAHLPPGPERDERVAEIDVAALLQSKIKVTPAKDSRLVYVVIEDGDAERAALLANEIAEAYIAENLALKLRATENASKWLEERLEELQQKSETSELAVYAFKKDADMLTTSLEDRLNMVSQRLNTYSADLTQVRTRIASLQARVDAILALRRDNDRSDEHWAEALAATAGNAPLLGQLKLRLAEQKSECAALADRYLDKHPALEGCRTKLATARGDLVRELDNVVKAAELELIEARNNERNLVSLVNATKAEAFEVNKKQIDFDKLRRNSDNNQRLYEQVLKRLKDIELSGLLRTSNVRILDAARPGYGPVKPNLRSALLLALALGLAAGIGLAFVLELLDNTISTQEEVEQRLQLPFLGLMPTMERVAEGADRDLFIHRQPKSPPAEFARSIRTNLLFMAPDRPLRTILVTSSGAQEGKSTTSINLGITMAQSGNRTLLVDTDLRRPRLHRALGVPNDLGVSSLIVGEKRLDEAIKSTEVPNLFVLPCGPLPPNPAELLHAKAFTELLKTLVGRFDRVVLDSPPLSAVADAAVLATQVDGTVLVLKAGKTTRELARRAVRSLDDVNAKLLGVILNDISLRDPKYGKYYSYYYGQAPGPDEVAS